MANGVTGDVSRPDVIEAGVVSLACGGNELGGRTVMPGRSLDDMTGTQRDLIVRDPNVCHGQAVIRDTRIMVSIVLDCLGAGMTEAEILADYPTLTAAGIRAAAAYGAELARDEYPAVAAQ